MICNGRIRHIIQDETSSGGWRSAVGAVLIAALLSLAGSVTPAASEDLERLVNELIQLRKAGGQVDKQIDMGERVLSLAERQGGAEDPVAVAIRDVLVRLYNKVGRSKDAVPLAEKSLEIAERNHGADHPETAARLNQLGNARARLGQYRKAEDIFRRALEIREKTLGPEHKLVATTLNDLAFLYRRDVRYEEADALYQRALAIREKIYGADHVVVARSLNNIANLYRTMKREGEALPLFERALKISEKKLKTTHPQIGMIVNNLAILHKEQGRFEKAEALYRRALEIAEQRFGKTHRRTTITLSNVGELYRTMGRHRDAEKLYKRVLAIREQRLGPDHPRLITALGNLANLSIQQAKSSAALDYARRAGAIVSRRIERSAKDERGRRERDDFKIFVSLVDAADRVATAKPDKRQALAAETLIAVQRDAETSASAALAQMAARVSAGDGELARTARKKQDLIALYGRMDKDLIKALAKPRSQGREDGQVSRLRARIADVENDIAGVDRLLAKKFPDFAELAKPKPLEAKEIQRLLGKDEALVTYQVQHDKTFVWAVTRSGLAWAKIGKGRKALDEAVAAVRKSVDLKALQGGEVEPVRLNDLHALYRDVLGPVEGSIRNKRHLLVVPAGALTSLPFHMLVTTSPGEGPDDYAGADWLIKRHATTTLPSVSSLRALRVLATRSKARKPLIGFGDPLYGDKAKRAGDAVTRSYTEFFRNERPDRSVLVAGLSPLPGTRDELIAVAGSLGAPRSALRLGADASEAKIKAEALDDYRVVYIATHGLVAGEIGGLGEPALSFTIPETLDDKDDGLLLASEAAQLKLDADWVVLSACNTAAGHKPGAEALSGLARAFFYAGARALLVSHWPAEDNAAARLTSQTFAKLAANPGMGRSEALRRVMLDMINDKSNATNAYPALWAPFVVVGKGGS